MMVLSNATTNVDIHRPNVKIAKGNALGYLDSSSSPASPTLEGSVALDAVGTRSVSASLPWAVLLWSVSAIGSSAALGRSKEVRGVGCSSSGTGIGGSIDFSGEDAVEGLVVPSGCKAFFCHGNFILRTTTE